MHKRYPEGFRQPPADTRFIGNPIDFVVFHGYTRVKDEKGNDRCRAGGSEEGEGKLTREETLIGKAVLRKGGGRGG